MTTILTSVTQSIDPAVERGEYLDFAVEVPEGTVALQLELAFEKVVDEFQLYGSLFTPDGSFRGHVQCPGGPGPRRLSFTVAEAGSSWGCLDGPIPAGTWTARIDLDRFVIAGEYDLTVTALAAYAGHREDLPETGTAPEASPSAITLPGWVRGELHTHSRHSDGATSVDRIVEAADAADLSFLAVSDHFTPSHWVDVDRLAARPATPVLLHSIEVTTHYGHANVHGLATWPGSYVDGADGAFTELAARVHAQGGLVSVNHPFSGRQAWRRTDAPWDVVDLIEVCNVSQGANNDAAIGLWDRLLASGHRVMAVAGTDSHSPDAEDGRLGVVTTLIRDSVDMTEAGVIAALAAGETCVSRGGALNLQALSGDVTARMGGDLPLDGPLELRIEVDSPANAMLFVFRDGLLWNLFPVRPGREVIAVADESGIRAPYRTELHLGDDSDQFWASCNRSHESLLALSNPIWVV